MPSALIESPSSCSCSSTSARPIRASFSSAAMLPSLARRTHKRSLHFLASSSTLLGKRCTPCENMGGSSGSVGLSEAMSRSQAESMLAKEAKGWNLKEDEQQKLSIERMYKTKNFVKALELCNRFGEVAEAEGHHPDLHITGWNKLSVELTTHARDGLTENDFIMAAKLDAVPKDDLLSKKKPQAHALDAGS